MDRRRWVFPALLLAACGTELDVQLVFEPSPCWQPQTTIPSLGVFVALEEIAKGVAVLRRVNATDDCLQASPPASLTPDSVIHAFATRGYVARDVDASQTSVVVVRPHARRRRVHRSSARLPGEQEDPARRGAGRGQDPGDLPLEPTQLEVALLQLHVALSGPGYSRSRPWANKLPAR